jgi:hypothetical protein
MAQTTVVSGYATNVRAAFRNVGFGVLIAWQRVAAPGLNFFTVGTSTIGGNDIIKGSASFVSFFDKFNYVDYSAYVMNWSVQRQLGQYPYGMILAQADVTLDNTSGLFLPNKDATIGSGILPNRPIRISANIGQESLMQFTGYTGQPELSINDRKLTLHAFDAMDYIAKYSLTTSGTTTSGTATTPSGYLVNVNSATALGYYLGVMGFNSNQYVLDNGLQQNLGYVSVADRKLGDVFTDIVIAEQGMAFVDETGLFRFWNRQHFLTTSGTSQFSLDYTNIVTLDYENTPVINDVIVTANPRSVQSKQKIWELQGYKEVPPASQLVLFADFADDFGDLPVTSVDTPIYISSATTSSFTTNSANDGSGSSASNQLTLTGVYLFGKTYKMTFQNSNANSIFITQLALYGTPAKVTSVIQQRYMDAVSIEAYGRNPSNNGDPLTIQNDYIQDNSTAYSLAYTLVNEYGQPRRRYKAEVFPRPELQIGDWGQLTVPDANNETKNMFIVGTQTQMADNASMRQFLWLEERIPKSYFTIGSSTIAGQDQIAP